MFLSLLSSLRHKRRDCRVYSIRCNVFSSALHLLTSYFLPIFSPFLSLLSALPFLLIKIYSHNLLLLSSGSERLIGNFSSKTIVQGKRRTQPIWELPAVAMVTLSTRGGDSRKGREGEKGDMIKCEHYSDLIADIQLSFYYSTLQLPFVVQVHTRV